MSNLLLNRLQEQAMQAQARLSQHGSGHSSSLPDVVLLDIPRAGVSTQQTRNILTSVLTADSFHVQLPGVNENDIKNIRWEQHSEKKASLVISLTNDTSLFGAGTYTVDIPAQIDKNRYRGITIKDGLLTLSLKPVSGVELLWGSEDNEKEVLSFEKEDSKNDIEL